ncbi:MAG: hypothetical protein U1E48_10955 [Paracoccaceae bacterium]
METEEEAGYFRTSARVANPGHGAARLAALRRGALAAAGHDGCIVPRADVYQGEYVAGPASA